MKRIIAMISAAVGIFTANAQSLTLKECLDRGLENNYQIRIARTDEQVSANNDSWAGAGGMPSVDLSAGYSGNMYSRNMTDQSGSVTATRDVLDHTLSASVGASWTVFNGFKVQATRDRLRELHAQGELRTRMAIEDLVADMVAAYYNLVRQTIRMANLNYSVELSRERVRIVQERYNIGNNSRLDLKQAQVYLNADSAASLKQRESLTSAMIAMQRLMGESVFQNYEIEDSTIILLPARNYFSLYTDVMDNNLSLIKAESDTRLAQEEMRSVNSRNYPYLRLSAGYGYSHNIYGSGATSGRDNWGPDFGATIGMNLIDGKHQTERKNAKLEIVSSVLSMEDVTVNLMSQLTDLWQAYENNMQLVNLERQNLLTAQETHQIACERYLIGDLSGIEMREAQETLLDAEESLLQAEYDAKICEISLLQISGHVMEYMK